MSLFDLINYLKNYNLDKSLKVTLLYNNQVIILYINSNVVFDEITKYTKIYYHFI